MIKDLLSEVEKETSYKKEIDDLTMFEMREIQDGMANIYDAAHAGYLLGFLHGYKKRAGEQKK